MATWYTHKCCNCDFSFHGSGKPDMLMSGYTMPVSCTKCFDISDLLINVINDSLDEFVCCTCENTLYRKWDFESKKCPVCNNGKMVIDEDGPISLAD